MNTVANNIVFNTFNNLRQHKVYVNTAKQQEIQLPIICTEEEGFIIVGGTIKEYKPLYCNTLFEKNQLVMYTCKINKIIYS